MVSDEMALVDRILALPSATQLGMLRTVVPKVLASLTRDQRHGFLRDVEAELQQALRGESAYDMRARDEDRAGHGQDSLRHATKANATYGRFLGRLATLTSTSQERAEEICAAVLTALEGCLVEGEAADLESQLPSRLREVIARYRARPVAWARDANPERFLTRISAELKISQPEAETFTRQVFLVLTEHVSPGEIEQVKHLLSADVRRLWP